MKVLIVLFACAAVALAQTPAQSLANTLNGLKEQMPCGFPDMDVPPLAPLKVNFFDLLQKAWIIKIYGQFQDLVVTGLNDYDVDDVTMNVLMLRAGFTMNFNKINIRGDLSLQSWIVKFLKIKNSGNLNMTINNLRVTVAARFGMVDGVMKIMEFVPTISLGGVGLDSTGFVIGKLTMKIVNSIAQTVVKKVFNSHVSSIEETVQNVVIPAANDYLKDMTVSELLKLLTGPSEPSTPCIPPAA